MNSGADFNFRARVRQKCESVWSFCRSLFCRGSAEVIGLFPLSGPLKNGICSLIDACDLDMVYGIMGLRARL